MNVKKISLRHSPLFDNHKLILEIKEKNIGLEGYIAIHRGNKKIPAFGATRMWPYENLENALTESLFLSKTMSYKAALANLQYGGGKAVLIKPKTIINREIYFKKFCEIINDLNGLFITGADVGINPIDVKLMKKYSPYIVGAKIDPVKFTALGLIYSIEESLNFYLRSKSISNISFAIQGLGKIGLSLIKFIYKYAKDIRVSDINMTRVTEAKKIFPKIIPVNPEVIHKQKVDVYSPCALSHCLNNKTVSELRCKIIVGGANNQLENDSIGENLYKMGILYAPDYIVNAGGLISVVDEYENKSIDEKRIIGNIKKIKDTLRRVLNISKTKKQATNIVSNSIAQNIIFKLN